MFIHGGYWQRNSKDMFPTNLISGPYTRGWATALPGYTLAPDATLAEITAEIHAALDWLAEHGALAWHRRIDRIVRLVGPRAAIFTAMALEPFARDCGSAAISGVFQLGPISDTYLNEKLRLSDEEIVTLSPLRLPVVEQS